MLVREANLNDAAAIARVHVDTWRTAYRGIFPEDDLARISYQQRENSWRQMLGTASENKHLIYVVENEVGQIIAFADGGSERTNNPVYESELYAIYILEAYQRQGIGRCLIQTLVKKLYELGFHSMLIWVLADNPACRFYESLGGQKVDSKQIERGGSLFDEIAYGWTDIKVLITESRR